MPVQALRFSVGEVAVVRAGYPFRGPIEPHPDGDVLAVQMKDVDPEQGIDWSGAARTRLTGRAPAEWLQADDLLFVARGNRFYAVCSGLPPMPAVCGLHIYHLRVRREDMLLPRFLAWQINQLPVQRLLAQLAEGSNQLSIRRPLLESVRIAVPALAVQHAVVELAGLARRERDVFEQLIANREQQLQHLAASFANTSLGPT